MSPKPIRLGPRVRRHPYNSGVREHRVVNQIGSVNPFRIHLSNSDTLVAVRPSESIGHKHAHVILVVLRFAKYQAIAITKEVQAAGKVGNSSSLPQDFSRKKADPAPLQSINKLVGLSNPGFAVSFVAPLREVPNLVIIVVVLESLLLFGPR